MTAFRENPRQFAGRALPVKIDDGDVMRTQTAFLLFMCLLHLLCHGDTPRFIALEQYEERNKVMQIRKMMEEELVSRDARERRLSAMEARLVLIPQEKSVEERLQSYLKLRRRVKNAVAELKSSNDRQIELAGMIDASMVSASMLPQVSAYLTEARSQLRTMGIEQKAERKRLEQLTNGIKMAIRNIPAPKEYATMDGVVMRLVQTSEGSFYVSKEPLKSGDVSLREAVDMANEISRAEGAKSRMPELKELKAMSQNRLTPDCAVWSVSKFNGNDIEQDRIMERFGVSMYMVWDSPQKLGRGRLFAELPNAKYPALGCYVVTDLRTGWNKRWNKVLEKLGGGLEDIK